MNEKDESRPVQDASRREALSRERILREAIEMIDRDGLQAVTMRSLGARMDVAAMALYRYVNGREDLLEGVVQTLVDEVHVDPEGNLGPHDGWQALLQWLAHSVRQVAVEHPAIFPLIATRHPAAPWLRPPLRSLRVVEEFLQGLTERGFTDKQAVRTYRIFTSFLIGHLLLEAAASGASTAPMDEPLDEGDADIPPPSETVEVSDYPTIARTAEMLAEDHTQEEFEQALEALLDRLDHELSQ
ncbi:MAG: TetR/AcrR family transcriptional regulator [Ornithinibacter sp.]